MKIAIIITTDPKSGSEESAGKAFNAMAFAKESLAKGDQVSVAFISTGARWPAELNKTDHPFNGLYNAIKPAIAGVSCGCAEFFGAAEGATACGLKQLKDNAIEGTPGFASIRHYLADGYQVLVF